MDGQRLQLVTESLWPLLKALLVGTIPLLGDLFDFAFKAQTRNLALLEHWLQSPQATERRSRRGLIVVPLAVLLLFVGLTITGLWVLYLVIHWLFTAAAG